MNSDNVTTDYAQNSWKAFWDQKPVSFHTPNNLNAILNLTNTHTPNMYWMDGRAAISDKYVSVQIIIWTCVNIIKKYNNYKNTQQKYDCRLSQAIQDYVTVLQVSKKKSSHLCTHFYLSFTSGHIKNNTL